MALTLWSVLFAGASAAMAATGHRVIYLNRDGGTYTPGPDDSSQNVSSVITQPATIPAWVYGDTAWTDFVQCVKDMYSPFDVEVTDQDPGTAAHIEVAVGGMPQDAGLPADAGGAAPIRDDCSVVEWGVVFVFAQMYGGDIRLTCWTATQEVGHALGLDHEYLCQDPMTYIDGCGPKSFQDVDAPCGETGPRACHCGGTTQNSFQHLMQVLGSSDKVPPVVGITDPPPGATVDPGFLVTANVTDDRSLDEVLLLIDGAIVQRRSSDPWQFPTPLDLGPGSREVEVRAYDTAGNVASDRVTVSVTNCTSDLCSGPPANTSDVVGGCAVTTGHQSTHPWWVLVFLALLLALRPRRMS